MKQALIVAMVLVVCLPVALQAGGFEALFFENWDAHTIDPLVWSNTDVSDLLLEDPHGDGDWALALKGSEDGGDPQWGDHIYSVATYPRGGGGIYVGWKAWLKPGINQQAGMNGGWHYDNVNPAYGGASGEATVDYVTPGLAAWEHGDGMAVGGVVDAAFNAAFMATNDKSNALEIRITLGDSQGGRWEYSADGNAWNAIRDTLGSGISVFPNNYIGFGPFTGQAGTTMIDDIIVDIIPEPFSVTLVGLGGLALARRRSR